MPSLTAEGHPLSRCALTGAQVLGSREAEALLVAMPEGASRLCDEGHDSDAIREAGASKNACANIPSSTTRMERFACSA